MEENQSDKELEVKNQLYKSLVKRLSKDITNFYHNIQILGVAGTAIGGTLTFTKGNLEDMALTTCLASITLFSATALYASLREEWKLIHDAFYAENPKFLDSRQIAYVSAQNKK